MGINISQVLLQPHERLLPPDDARRLDVNDRPAIERIAAQIRWGGSPQAWREIRNLARQEQRSVTNVRRDILVESVSLALMHMHEAQKFKVDKAWVVNDNKRIVEIIPYNLTAHYFEMWLHQEARKAAEAVVLGQHYPATADMLDALHEARKPSPHTADESLYHVLYYNFAPFDYDDEFLPVSIDPDERHEDAQQQLGIIRERLTPKERDLLSSLERGESRAERAERTGDNPPAVRKQYQRFNEHVTEIAEAQKSEADRECERCDMNEQAAHRRMRELTARAQEAQRRGAWDEVHDYEERAWNALHDAYLWRDRADLAFAYLSDLAKRSWIDRRFTREEAWNLRDAWTNDYRYPDRSSWQDKKAVREEERSEYVLWRLRKQERSRHRDTATSRALTKRACAAWDEACSRDPILENRVEASLLAAAVRGTEVRRAYRLIGAIANAHAAERARKRTVYYGYFREERPGLRTDAVWPVNRFRRCIREAWEDAWRDAWWGDIGDDELPMLLGNDYDRLRQLGEHERMSHSLAS